jgi:hypothetical protein
MADILMANLDPRQCRPEAPSIQRWGAALLDQEDWNSGSLGTHERLDYWGQIRLTPRSSSSDDARANRQAGSRLNSTTKLGKRCVGVTAQLKVSTQSRFHGLSCQP